MPRYRELRKKVDFNKHGIILCEGETEVNYFNGLINHPIYKRKLQSISVKIYKPKDHSPQGLVKEAKKMMKESKSEKNPFDFIWVIFDKDGHSKIPEAFELARTSKPKINISLTLPCFEYFVLLHFEKTTKPFVKCDEVVNIIKQKYICNYEKATDIFNILYDKNEIGLANSLWVEKQFEDEIKDGKKPYELSTYIDIHNLINYLFSLI